MHTNTLHSHNVMGEKVRMDSNILHHLFILQKAVTDPESIGVRYDRKYF